MEKCEEVGRSYHSFLAGCYFAQFTSCGKLHQILKDYGRISSYAINDSWYSERAGAK